MQAKDAENSTENAVVVASTATDTSLKGRKRVTPSTRYTIQSSELPASMNKIVSHTQVR